MDAINATSVTTIAETSRGLLGDYGAILASATALFLGGGVVVGLRKSSTNQT